MKRGWKKASRNVGSVKEAIQKVAIRNPALIKC